VNRPRDVLELLLAQILERQIDLAGDILLHARRNAHAARLRQPFEARGNVDAVAKDVAVFDESVPQGAWQFMSRQNDRNHGLPRL